MWLLAAVDKIIPWAPLAPVGKSAASSTFGTCPLLEAPLAHCRYGVSTWTHLANDEGSCPPPCGADTEQ